MLKTPLRSRHPARRTLSSAAPLASSMILIGLALLIVLGRGLESPATTQTQQSQPGTDTQVAINTGGSDNIAHAAEARQGARLNPATIAQKDAAMDGDFISHIPPDGTYIDAHARHAAGPNASPREIEAARTAFMDEWLRTSYHGPEPEQLESLLDRERAILEGDSDNTFLSPDQAVEGSIRVLAVAVEFAGSDTVEDFSHPVSRYDSTCITETITYEGPLHNEIPPPAARDNYTWWLPEFDAEYYEKLIFSEEGVTERIRADLIDPVDGLPGIDISGRTMATYFDEATGGTVTFDGGSKGVVAWIQVPHSVAYYASNSCIDGVAGGASSQRGLPTNPRYPNGRGALLEDIATAINESDPDFPWAEYDVDGDGLIDHFQMLFAGMSRGTGGGSYGYQTIWPHRGSVDGGRGGLVVDDSGTPDDDTDDTHILRYTAQAENTSLGTLVHEFGHDFGLPDLYDTSYGGTSNAAWWELMAYGGSTGAIRGSQPAQLSTWMKMLLGWEDPRVVVPTADAKLIDIGQITDPPEGTESSLMIEMPPSGVTLATPQEGSTQMWWSGNDSNWANVSVWRTVDLSSVTGTISLTFDVDYVTEPDADFLIMEVRPGGSSTYVQSPGYRVGTGELLTTPEDYADPKGSMARFGDLQHGYTGDSGGWTSVYHDLTPYAGQTIRIRPRYATDGSLRERGAFLDNFRILAGETIVWQDPVESGNRAGWRTSNSTFTHLYGAGFQLSSGTHQHPWYYLLEWRNLDGFDGGLRSTYQEVFRNLTEDGATEILADWIPSNTPGLLVWLRDTRFGSSNGLVSDRRFFTQPSEGPKGGLLLVDSHPEPLRGQRHGRYTNEAGSVPFPQADNWHGNSQATNAAFGLNDTPPVTLTYATGVGSPDTYLVTQTHHAALPSVPGFHDALGYFPGIEVLPEPVIITAEDGSRTTRGYAFIDPDSSVVVPASGYYPPRTPLGFTGVSEEGTPGETVFVRTTELTTGHSGAVTGDDILVVADVGEVDGPALAGQQTGNPGDYDVHFGYHFVVEDQADDGSQGTVRIWRNEHAAEVTLALAAEDASLAVSTGLRNVGGAYSLTLYSAFDPDAAQIIDGSVPEGAWPVSASAAEIVTAYMTGGPEALEALEVPVEDALAVVWAGHVGSGQRADLTYTLAPSGLGNAIEVTTSAYAAEPDLALDVRTTTLRYGSTIYLPIAKRPE